MLSQHSTAYIQMDQQYFPSCTEVCRCIFTVFVLLVYQVLDLYKGPHVNCDFNHISNTERVYVIEGYPGLGPRDILSKGVNSKPSHKLVRRPGSVL